jgi:hypothetical protein
MKIHQLLDSVSIIITNEERSFIDGHQEHIPLSSLDDHEVWVAQNLVRKNVYQLTKDNRHIVINKGHENQQSTI